MKLIHSKTPLLSTSMLIIFLIIAFLENNHAMSAQMLLTKNEVPFAKASIIAGLSTVILLYMGLTILNLGIWAMILAPGISQAIYNNWYWPRFVIKDLKINISDYWNTLIYTIKENTH